MEVKRDRLTAVVSGAEARYASKGLSGDVELRIGPGEDAALIGPNGGGKSLLAEYLSGGVSLTAGTAGTFRADGSRVRQDRIATLSFRDIYRAGGAGADNYYQKRWQATEVEDSPLAGSLFGAQAGRAAELLRRLGAEGLLSKRVIYLSSGEVRKLMIVRGLLREPEVLIVDNPFIGLDSESREAVGSLLSEAARELGLKVVCVVCHPKDLPSWADRVVGVMGRGVVSQTDLSGFVADVSLRRSLFPEEGEGSTRVAEESVGRLRDLGGKADYETAISMRGVRVAYGGVEILRGVDWTVGRGERWSLTGRNGSGKSTALSLVTGDHPQAYANDIVLFGRRRGTGESIWDIKRRIGYVSPDMHTFYTADISAEDVVASGYHDTIGLYRVPTEGQRAMAREWMRAFGCLGLGGRRFLELSYGEQRLVLLTRAFVKSPSLLILDEPLHGLDAGKKAMAKRLIEAYCSDPRVSLIYVTHYAEEIPECVDHGAVMERGVLRVV